jgi:hypothetical protein
VRGIPVFGLDGSHVHEAIVNPWNSGEDNLHPDWEEVQSSEWSALQGIGASVSGNALRGFLLWVPLRRKQHLRKPNGAQTGAIIDRFPGDDLGGPDLRFLAEKALPSRLAVILPLLLNLEEFSYRSLGNMGNDLSVSISADRRLERGPGEATSTGIVAERARPVLKFYGEKREQRLPRTASPQRWRDRPGNPITSERRAIAFPAPTILERAPVAWSRSETGARRRLRTTLRAREDASVVAQRPIWRA